MSHTVTITELPNEEHDDVYYDLAGDHDGSCISYRECLVASHRHPSDEYGYRESDWSTKRVTQIHTFIDGSWMLPDGGCGFYHARADTADFDAYLVQLAEETGIRTFGVDIEWDGDWWSARPFVIDSPSGRGTP